MNDHGNSEWSPQTSVTTTSEYVFNPQNGSVTLLRRHFEMFHIAHNVGALYTNINEGLNSQVPTFETSLKVYTNSQWGAIVFHKAEILGDAKPCLIYVQGRSPG